MFKEMVASQQTNANDSIGYEKVFETLKVDIRQAQLKAASAVTEELILLYWRIGEVLSEKVKQGGWGAKTLERLARDRCMSCSGSPLRNLNYMKQFFEGYPDANCAAAAAQMPLGHNMLLLNKIKDSPKRLWYNGGFAGEFLYYPVDAIRKNWFSFGLLLWICSDRLATVFSRLEYPRFSNTFPAI